MGYSKIDVKGAMEIIHSPSVNVYQLIEVIEFFIYLKRGIEVKILSPKEVIAKRGARDLRREYYQELQKVEVAFRKAEFYLLQRYGSGKV